MYKFEKYKKLSCFNVLWIGPEGRKSLYIVSDKSFKILIF